MRPDLQLSGSLTGVGNSLQPTSSARNHMRRRAGILLVGMVALVGCYRATIDTGVKPSNVVIEKRWASGWIFGLVPPSTVETAAQCPSGVAKVETKLSFLNQLVSFITLSVYTPMRIRVTGAEGMVTTPTSMILSDSVSLRVGTRH